MLLPLPPLRLDQLVLNLGIGKEGRQSVKSKDLPATGRSKVELRLADTVVGDKIKKSQIETLGNSHYFVGCSMRAL